MEVAADRLTVTAEQLGLNPGVNVNGTSDAIKIDRPIFTRAFGTDRPIDRVCTGLDQREEFEGQLDYDLGNLMACDPSPQDTKALMENPDAYCLEQATKITQSLVNQLFKLPGKLVGMGRVVELPDPSYRLPRQKPLPTPRPPTRWEKFAQQKGIQKRKRSVKVWDEDQQEWRRRFGYQRAGDHNDIPIIEASSSDKVGEDPFTAMQKERKDKKAANKERELANAKNTLKKAGRGAVPSSLKLAASLPEHGRGRPAKRKDLKDDIKAISRQAGVATASQGKFDEKVSGEKPGERVLGSKRQKFEPSTGNTKAEKAKATSFVDRILREKADTVSDMNLDFAVQRALKQKTDDLQDEEGTVQFRKRGKGGKGGRGGKELGKGGKPMGKRDGKGGKGVKAAKKGAKKR